MASDMGIQAAMGHMDISSIPSSLVQNIANNATQTGDAVSISVMRKAMDLQGQQAMQLIESVAKSAPQPGVSGGHIDTYA